MTPGQIELVKEIVVNEHTGTNAGPIEHQVEIDPERFTRAINALAATIDR